MSFDINEIQRYSQLLENNVNNIKNSQNSLILSMSINNIEKIILKLKKKYCNEDLFNKYVKKEIFSYILSFLSKKYVISKRSICKNWHKILTCDFIKNALGPFNEPYNMYYLDFIKNRLRVIRVNNKKCYLDCHDGEIIIMNDDLVVGKYYLENVLGICGNSELICFYNNKEIITSKYNNKIVSEIKSENINGITMDDKYIYILKNREIIQYNTEGTYIKRWNIEKHSWFYVHDKIIVDNDEIYVYGECYGCIKVYSSDGKFIRDIGSGYFDRKTSFDIYKDHIYVLDLEKKLLRVFTKNGEMIYYKECACSTCYNLFIIDDILYNYQHNIYKYKLKFY